MKKLLAVIMSVIVSLAGCEKYTADVAQYRQVANYIDFPGYFPASVEEYTVNAYSYRLYSYMDICYEIFLDISVSEEQLDALIEAAKEDRATFCEKAADYAEGYYEITFSDLFTTYDREAEMVGMADIEKIVYNPDSCNVVFICVYSMDIGVYPVDEVAYFNRFVIEATEYAQRISN